MNKLTNLLLKAQQPSKFGTDQKFIPKGILEHLIDRKMVELILGKTEEEEDLRDFVLEKATMLLALAALSGIKKSEIHEAMKAFMDANIEDSHLPLDEESLNRIATDDDNSDDEGVWSVATKYHFRNTQPKFLAPVFDLSRHNHDFPSSAILPFIKEAKALGQGTFGEVYKYGIHPAHMIKGTDEKHPEYQEFKCPEFVAVKKIRPGDSDERGEMVASWEKEGAVLRDMNKLKQIHIVPFLTAFRHGHQGNEDHYLMFEWASGGNLRQLWSDLKRERLSSGIVKAALKQLLGLSEAIYNAHEPSMAAEASERSNMFAKDGLRGDFFRHGDLKPENILWFKDEEHDNETGFNMGTLKIGDWGLAKRQNIPTQLRTHRTTTEFGTCRYEPPEEITGLTVNLPDNIKRRSRLYDIWGMGCIFLEFLIWLLYGTEGLKKFNHSMITKQNTCPPFYEVVERDGKPHGVVHPSVVKWMDHIANDPACNGDGTALGDLLKVIREDLLVVDLPEKLGSHISETEQAALNSWAQTTTDQDDLQAADSNDVPQITVNEDRSTTSQDNQKPTSNMVMRRKKPRARARQFYLRMEGIVDLDYNGEEYWLPAEPGPPLSLQGSTVLDTVPRNDSELLSLASPKGLVTIRTVSKAAFNI
ncbi:unnamed protein product [Clonostachys rosea f. rosea IK726]|uniref:Uncharacterized protein n=1 Tax=Clonostachys rosea f. rosea IK726 TaxID=1349383 RepID=A0ACA9TNU9_BIOOC|nr:unnamed protein product [Clonostachys rosea f. rosea IK726]